MHRFVLVLGAVVSTACIAADGPAAAVDALAGAWSYDAALSAPIPDGGSASSSGTGAAGNAGQHHGGGKGGGMGGAGMGGGGMGHGGGGGGGGHHHGGHDASAGGNASGKADAAEQGERGLARAFAKNVTITPLKQRIRFDDGTHAIELDRDGMNISGPGVGGTVALTAIKPDLVIETLTDSGYSLSERYHLAEDGRHLELHVSLKRPGVDQAREFVHVFDRPLATTAGASAPSTSP
jgi:hypothetical protein